MAWLTGAMVCRAVTAPYDPIAIEAIISGDEPAIRAFVDRFRSRLEAIARRKGVLAQDCAALAHETIGDAVQKVQAGHLREPAKLPGFVHGILANKISDYWRHRGPVTLALDELGESHDPALMTGPQSDDVLAVQQALSRLRPEEQIVLWLHDVERYTLDEVGQIVGLRKSAVWSRLQNARYRFRFAIDSGGKPPPVPRLKS